MIDELIAKAKKVDGVQEVESLLQAPAGPSPASANRVASDAPARVALLDGKRDSEPCLRCGAAMEWRHQTWQCPRCAFKLGCCEGEPQSCSSAAADKG